MSSYLLSVMGQSNSGSDWKWFLIFIIFIVVLAIALIIMARFSKKDAAELEHHEEEVHLDQTRLASAAVVDPEPEPEPVSTPAEPDDLKKLEGIGPKVSSLLNENGIFTFAQLAETPVDKLEEILDANKLQMMHPGSWPQQARLAADGNWADLEKLQDELQGGR